MSDHLFIDDTQDVEGKFIGWDYAHAGDYAGYYGDDEVWKDEKKWTTQEIFEEVKDACFQLKLSENDTDYEETKEIKEMIKNDRKNFYRKWIKEDVFRMLISFGLAFITTQLVFFTNSIIFKVLNVLNIILALWIFVRNAKSFIEDLDKLADTD